MDFPPNVIERRRSLSFSLGRTVAVGRWEPKAPARPRPVAYRQITDEEHGDRATRVCTEAHCVGGGSVGVDDRRHVHSPLKGIEDCA